MSFRPKTDAVLHIDPYLSWKKFRDVAAVAKENLSASLSPSFRPPCAQVHASCNDAVSLFDMSIVVMRSESKGQHRCQTSLLKDCVLCEKHSTSCSICLSIMDFVWEVHLKMWKRRNSACACQPPSTTLASIYIMKSNAPTYSNTTEYCACHAQSHSKVTKYWACDKKCHWKFDRRGMRRPLHNAREHELFVKLPSERFTLSRRILYSSTTMKDMAFHAPAISQKCSLSNTSLKDGSRTVGNEGILRDFLTT